MKTNLDLREMPHFERHEKIFSILETMKIGDILKVTNDHDPKPLKYMLDAENKGEFKFEYESNGPRDWVVNIKRINKNKKQEIKDLLKELKTDNSEKIKEKGKKILRDISASDLALIEQEIISEGITRKDMRKLCDVHLEIMKDSLKKDLKLKSGHPVHTLMEEHKRILDFIKALKEIAGSLDSAKKYGDINIEMLKHIAEHLVEADYHHKREEDVLFPALEEKGVTEPPQIMSEEHVDLKKRKKELLRLVKNHKSMTLKKFVKNIKENAEYIIQELPNHIYKEDNILYPMAIEVIPEDDWEAIKEKCDKIGYCCFTPEN